MAKNDNSQQQRLTVMDVFSEYLPLLEQRSKGAETVSHDSVYQPANDGTRELVNQIVASLMLPGSELLGFENIRELYERSQAGESCLIVSEHYSNFDLPSLFHLLQEKGEKGEAIAKSVVAMAGAKLNEESKIVRAFAESFTRIVIYPVRALQAISDPEEYAREHSRSRAINMAALREMVRKKNSGRIILVFPAGTRYRPDKPDSAKGLPQIDSYMKQFDHVCPVGIAGNLLLVNPSGDMSRDYPQKDLMIYKAGELIDPGETGYLTVT
ncbi:MAG: 1-acyl-sn-glycerol-3-phosphate acyltransferase, partial [Spirochaetales bacterium]